MNNHPPPSTLSTGAEMSTGLVVVTNSELPRPSWYHTVNFDPRRDNRSNNVAISQLRTYILKVKTEDDVTPTFKLMRQWLHTLLLAEDVTLANIKASKVMIDGSMHSVMDRSYDGSVDYPSDIRLLMMKLYNKWFGGSTDGFLLHGIITSKTTNSKRSSKSHKIDPRHTKRNPYYTGEGHLSVGD